MTTLDAWPLSVDDRTALAGLVAHPTDPHARELNADNENVGRLPGIAEAVTLDVPYMVNVAPDVLALDGDDPELLPVLENLAAELVADGWPVLRVDSGREGHRHLWAVIPDPEAMNRAKFDAATAGFAPRAVMRPPGAPHRFGLPVRVLDDPETFSDAVEAVRAAEAVYRDYAERDRFGWWELLRTGQWPKGWEGEGSSSTMVWQVCIGAIRAGNDLETVRGWLADEKNKGGSGYRRRLTRNAKSHADYWLDHYVWPKAVLAARRRPNTPADAAEARHQLDTIRAAVDAYPWTGIGGTTDRAVLVALLDRAHARGSLTPTMSHRELAEAAPCHRNTAKAATDRLRAAGWLLVAEKGRGITELGPDGTYREQANATRWRLRLPLDHPARGCATEGTPPARTSLSGTSTRALLDVGRWRGLGLNAPRVLDALAHGPLTTAELAEALAMNRRNLGYRLLPKLAKHRLVVATADGWELPVDLDAALAATAEALDLTGKADAVAAHHETERAGYLEHRERTRPNRVAATRRRISAARRRTLPPPQPALPLGEAPRRPVDALEPCPAPEPPREPVSTLVGATSLATTASHRASLTITGETL